jgi:hypothetical protein
MTERGDSVFHFGAREACTSVASASSAEVASDGG